MTRTPLNKNISLTQIAASLRNEKEAAGRTNDDDIELETTLEKFVFNLLGDRVEPDIRGSTNLLNFCGSHCEREGW